MEVSDLANIKSAKKRILVIETKTLRNKTIKSKIKTLVKKVELAAPLRGVSTACIAMVCNDGCTAPKL